MKKILLNACIAYACITSSPVMAHFKPYDFVNPAQEKVRIILKQLEVTYNWLDTIYAARERFYLSGIALDYLHFLKYKCKPHRECSAFIEKLEAVLQKLHVQDLSKKEFEKIRCAAEPLLQLPHFASKPTIIV
jgi:hypothetical protein